MSPYLTGIIPLLNQIQWSREVTNRDGTLGPADVELTVCWAFHPNLILSFILSFWSFFHKYHKCPRLYQSHTDRLFSFLYSLVPSNFVTSWGDDSLRIITSFNKEVKRNKSASRSKRDWYSLANIPYLISWPIIGEKNWKKKDTTDTIDTSDTSKSVTGVG